MISDKRPKLKISEEYYPEYEAEKCPECGSPVTVIGFADDAFGYNKQCKEHNCTNDECSWWKWE